MNDRKLINFTVKEEDYDFQEKEMIPYWENRSIRHKILAHMTPEWKDAYEAGMFTEFMEQRGPGRTVGSENIYNKGFLEHKADIKLALEKLDYMQSLFILSPAPCKTQIILDVIDISFHYSPDFIGIIPFFGSTDCPGISTKVLFRIYVYHTIMQA